MEKEQSLGKRIAELRKMKGLTQEQLGEKLGVSAQAVSKWENDLSYPDISLLPLIGQFFDVSVDELLGLKPLDPKVIIVDKDESAGKAGKRPFRFEWNAGRWPTIATCIGLILICLFFILHSMTGLFPYIKVGDKMLTGPVYVWPIIVFTIGLISVKYHCIFGIIFMLFGAYEFTRTVLLSYGITLIAIPWYVIVLILAIMILARTILRNMRPANVDHMHKGGNHTPVSDISFEGDRLSADMHFGSATVDYDRVTFNGGEIDSSFGDYTVDLIRVTTFSAGCLLEIDNSFGNLTLILPRNVKLTKSSENSFAAFSLQGEPDPDAAYELIIRSDISFGSVQVRYQ